MSLRSRMAAPMVAAILALGVVASGLAAPAPALASDGYVETAATTYTVNPAAHRVDVAIDISFKNTTASTATTRYYFSAVYVWLERESAHIGATVSGSGSAAVHRVRRGGAFDEYEVGLSPAVFYGQSRRIHVTYQLPGGAPRSTSDIRVDPAIASFCVVAQGDDGGTTKVVIPSGYDVTISGGGGGSLTPVSGPAGAATRTWTSGTLDQPYAFWACLSGTNAAGYATTTVTSPKGRQIELEAWPEDQQWKTEVQGELNGILTKLETIVGRELPGNGPIVLREVAGSELGNYAGFYDSQTGVIVMGEDLGQGDVIAHELSHAWFNERTFSATWMSEGMAEWARISTVTDSCPTPEAYPTTGSPNLANWLFVGPRATSTDIAIVHYQYEAACYIVSSLATEAGPDRWRAVLTAFFDNQLAYQAPGLVLTHPKYTVTWQQWLDTVDELGLVPAGVTDLDGAQKLLATYGIAIGTATLEARSKARARYHALIAQLGDWTMPEAILRPMSTWSFASAESAMDQVDAIRASVAKADAALPGIDAANGPVRLLFEHAKSLDDLKAAAAAAADQATAATAVAAAAARVAAPRDALTSIGLAGTDLDAPIAAATTAAKSGDLEATQADVAQVNALLDAASQQGTLRLGLAMGVVLALVLLLAFVAIRVRRRRRLAAVSAPPPATLDAPEGPPRVDP